MTITKKSGHRNAGDGLRRAEGRRTVSAVVLAQVAMLVAAVALPLAAVALLVAAVALPLAAVAILLAAVALPLAAVALPLAAVALPLAAVVGLGSNQQLTAICPPQTVGILRVCGPEAPTSACALWLASGSTTKVAIETASVC